MEETPEITVKITKAAEWVGRIAKKEKCEHELQFAPVNSDWDYYVMLTRGGEQMPVDIERVRQWLVKGETKSAEQYVRATIAMLPPAIKPEPEPTATDSFAHEMERLRRQMEREHWIKASEMKMRREHAEQMMREKEDIYNPNTWKDALKKRIGEL